MFRVECPLDNLTCHYVDMLPTFLCVRHRPQFLVFGVNNEQRDVKMFNLSHQLPDR